MTGHEREDPRLLDARLRAAGAFFCAGATMRAALEGAGFEVGLRIDTGLHPRVSRGALGLRVVSQAWPWESPEARELRFGAAMTVWTCRRWMLGLGDEWEAAGGDEEPAREWLAAWWARREAVRS